jgi:putative acetyltransferase
MLTIRVARPNDATAMIEARREAILSKGMDHYQRSIVVAWVADAAEERFTRYVQQIDDPDFVVLIAEADDEVIGFAIANQAKEELSAIYVKPNITGRVGSALLSQLETHAFEFVDTLTVVAALTAVRFYKANGYLDEGLVYYVDSDGSDVPCRNMRKRRATVA